MSSSSFFVCLAFFVLAVSINAELDCEDTPTEALRSLCEQIVKLEANFQEEVANVKREMKKPDGTTSTPSFEKTMPETTTPEIQKMNADDCETPECFARNCIGQACFNPGGYGLAFFH